MSGAASGQPETELQKGRWRVGPWGCFSRKTVSLLRILKPHEMHSFCLFSVAAMINPSLLPWGMAGRTIIILCSKAADFSLGFIIHHFGQVFWKVWVIVMVIGKDRVTPQPFTYGSVTQASSNEVIYSPAKQNLLALDGSWFYNEMSSC